MAKTGGKFQAQPARKAAPARRGGIGGKFAGSTPAKKMKIKARKITY